MKTKLGTNLQYLSGEIFKDGGEIDRSTGTDTLGVLAGLEETSDTTDGKLQAGFTTPGGGFLGGARSQRFASAGHESRSTGEGKFYRED